MIVCDHIVPAVVREATGETIESISITGDPCEVFLEQVDEIYGDRCAVCIQIDKSQWPVIRDLIDKCLEEK